MSGAPPTIAIQPSYSSWPAQFARAEAKIRVALGARMVLFRDRLRTHERDSPLYERAEHELAKPHAAPAT